MKLLPGKYACVHGHFYQPPRENPWLDEGEPEESASPFRDWNTRILHECYGPNAAVPSLDGFGRVRELSDNYRLVSFNFGPTLFSWLERRHPALYRRVIEADRASALERGGHGNALAQPFVHAILPLQTLRDKLTMVRWGIADFVHRFGRRPEGMWLPETGVDDETLEVLAAEGIRFTILANAQAGRIRNAGAGDDAWTEPPQGRLNTSRPYRWNSRREPGRSLALFFYYGELHEELCHRDGLSDGLALGRKVLARYLPDGSTQLVHTASDGEYFGHHRPHGHKALNAALRWLESEGVKLVNYAQFLDLYPPPQEAEVRQNTAWSCGHGLGRWSADCGCKISPDQASQQGWRKPLLDAMDWLKAAIDGVYEREGGALFKDPWAARDGYVSRLLEATDEAADAFLARAGRRHPSAADARAALRLCEMQRHRLLMLTSCGWFFDDIAGLEACQNLRFAARAIELAEGFGASLLPEFRSRLAAAPCNDARYGDGAGVLDRLVLPLRADLERAAAHAAISAHLGGPVPPRMPRRFSIAMDRPSRADKRLSAGRDRSLGAALVRVVDAGSWERLERWAVVHQQDRLDLACWIGPGKPPAGLEARFQELDDAQFRAGLCRDLGEPRYGLDALFAEERAAVLSRMLSAPPGAPLRRFLEDWRRALRALALDGAGQAEDEVLRLMAECRGHDLHVDQLPDTEAVHAHLRGLQDAIAGQAPLPAGAVRAAGSVPAAASRLMRWIEAAEASGFHLSIWELQDFCARWLRGGAAGRGSAVERDAARTLARKIGLSEALWGETHDH